MITVHHLNNSHSHVVLWLMEELGEDYRMVNHQRDPQTFRSPDTLRAVHPAAKSPTIEDHGTVMIESTGILLYLLEKYGKGRLRPPADSAEAMQFFQWLTYMEGSAKAMVAGLFRVSRDPADPRRQAAEQAAAVPLRLIDDALAGQEFIAAGQFTAADIQLTFLEELTEGMGAIGPYKNMQAHLERMRQRDGYKRAEAKGGPVGFRRMFGSARA